MKANAPGFSIAMLAIFVLSACGGGGGGGGGGNPPPPPVTPGAFTVGGTISGLSGSIILRNNGTDDLNVTSNGAFTFGTALANGASYSVTVSGLGSAQACSVNNGSGVISGANVTSVAIDCVGTTPPPPSGSIDTNFGDQGKVLTDFSGPRP